MVRFPFQLPARVMAREQALLAPYAMRSEHSAGRKYPEPSHDYRGPYQRDRDRILHSAAYRRLSSKTQVFTGELGDYHRTRLTHTLEVASVSRTIGRALALNEDLIEALALVHDLGHPPFGHTGEDVLDECLAAEGGFSHNRQALRIVELLETRYAAFPGLNLTHEVLQGQATRIQKGKRVAELLEIQTVEAADSITYDTHDADDALELHLISLDDLFTTALWANARRRVEQRSTGLTGDDLRRAVLHELIDWQISDIIARVVPLIERADIGSPQEARQAGVVIAVSPELAEQKAELEKFLFDRVYRHPQVMQHREAAQEMLREMFDRFCANPQLLPQRFQQRAADSGVPRAVGDYLAGMTDRYADATFRRLRGILD